MLRLRASEPQSTSRSIDVDFEPCLSAAVGLSLSLLLMPYYFVQTRFALSSSFQDNLQLAPQQSFGHLSPVSSYGHHMSSTCHRCCSWPPARLLASKTHGTVWWKHPSVLWL